MLSQRNTLVALWILSCFSFFVFGATFRSGEQTQFDLDGVVYDVYMEPELLAALPRLVRLSRDLTSAETNRQLLTIRLRHETNDKNADFAPIDAEIDATLKELMPYVKHRSALIHRAGLLTSVAEALRLADETPLGW